MRILVMLLVGVLLAGCSFMPGGDEEGGPVKNVDERGMRTELDPLTKRFPALGQPLSAQWESGTLGDDRVPGPTSYWIDAVVELDPQVADTMRLDAQPPSGQRPDLTPDVAAEVPDGRLAAVPDLDHDGWDAQAWLVEGSDTLVLSARGQ
ncbi:hypothetical protein [Janibacter anophelis]|uniref:hypothetical protein n=1 Tax=Janibacter anophelis TaxID=319054 RepID=UPI000DEF8C21|nr:hypothetical protein [Janibacter anophelis]